MGKREMKAEVQLADHSDQAVKKNNRYDDDAKERFISIFHIGNVFKLVVVSKRSVLRNIIDRFLYYS